MKHAFPPIRFSHLKVMGRSPQHYAHNVEHGRPDGAGLRLGRLVHHHVLGAAPDDEDGKVIVYEGERRGNPWKLFEAEQTALHPGCDIVTEKEYESAEPIARAVLEDETAAQFLRGDREKRILWRIGDRECSSRPDVVGRANFGPFVTDLKTTTDASPNGFARLAIRMGYAAQLAFYLDAVRHSGIEAEDAYIVAVETVAPFAVTTFRLSPQLLDFGRRTYRTWFERLMVCEQSKHFPGYSTSVVPLDVPPWLTEFGTEEESEAAE